MEYQGRKRKHESSSSLSDEYPKFEKARLLSDNSGDLIQQFNDIVNSYYSHIYKNGRP